LPNIEEDGKSWLRRPKLHKRVVAPHKKKNIVGPGFPPVWLALTRRPTT
jgi:hypothetical protein